MPKLESKTGVPITEPLPVPEIANNDRLTILTQIRHEHLGVDPMSLDSSQVFLTGNQEEPYTRRITVTEEWTTLNYDFLNEIGVSVVVLENLEGKHPLVQPTKEEKADIKKRVVEVSYSRKSDESDLLIPGGLIYKFPVNAKIISVRCQSGKAKLRLVAFGK